MDLRSHSKLPTTGKVRGARREALLVGGGREEVDGGPEEGGDREGDEDEEPEIHVLPKGRSCSYKIGDRRLEIGN
ncbi:hypothetical protein NL676_022425 [Syzygium grande]|nr:hypothetical protein NL676_022425 [Syzygium grande]